MVNADKEQISVYVGSNLVQLLDKLATKNERSRSIEVERAIRFYLLLNMDEPDFWRELYQRVGLVS